MIMLPKLEGYVIYNPANGLFSGGGMNCGSWSNWRKNPKIWKKIGHLKSHLNQFVYEDYYSHYNITNRTRRIIIIFDSYIGCKVVDITTQQEINLDIVKYLENKANEIVNNHSPSEYVIEHRK